MKMMTSLLILKTTFSCIGSERQKPLRQSRRVQSQEEVSINEDGVASKIQFLLSKNHKENAISDVLFLRMRLMKTTNLLEAKKNLQLKEAELSENMDSTVEEEES